MIQEVKLWVARDKDGMVNLFKNKPKRLPSGVFIDDMAKKFEDEDHLLRLGYRYYPELKHEDSPKYLTVEL